MSRVELLEENLELIVGGNLKYVWSDAQQLGYLWINDAQDPSAAATKYYFNDKQAMLDYVAANHLRYGDYGTVDKMLALKLIRTQI